MSTRSAIPAEAPDFTDGYPSGGSAIGPAWQAAWTLLRNDASAWRTSTELVSAMQDAAPVADKTARNLLRAARQHGALAVRYAPEAGRRHPDSTYRIA